MASDDEGRPLKLGTRGSALARTQSGHVASAVTAATGRPVELVIIRTRGDQVQDRPLAEVGGKGLFTKEIEEALLDGSIDLAVHSFKDMPTESPAGLVFGAVPERADPHDALVGARLADLPEGAVVGTGSVRRRLQLLAARPDLEIRGIRGNVDTRIEKVARGEYAAAVLACAGLERLGRSEAIAERLSSAVMVPAPAQGALAVQCRADDAATLRALGAIHCGLSAARVAVERAYLAAVSGGCDAPAACLAWFEGGELVAEAFHASDPQDPATGRRATLRGSPLHAETLGRALAKRVMARG
jgi:hydroxymethylbilane synthase